MPGRIEDYLVVQTNFGLLGITQEEEEDVCLHQDLPAVLPALQQLVPAHLQLLQPLLEGQVGQLSFLQCQDIIDSLNLGIILLIAADLLLEQSMVVQQLLGLREVPRQLLPG